MSATCQYFTTVENLIQDSIWLDSAYFKRPMQFLVWIFFGSEPLWIITEKEKKANLGFFIWCGLKLRSGSDFGMISEYP